MESKMVPLGGLWKNTDKNGKTYLSGKLGYGAKILIFTNSYKEKDSDPDYKMYIAESKREDAGAGEPPDDPAPPFPQDDDVLPF